MLAPGCRQMMQFESSAMSREGGKINGRAKPTTDVCILLSVMSGAEPPTSATEQFERFDTLPESVQRRIRDVMPVRVFDGEKLIEMINFEDVLRGTIHNAVALPPGETKFGMFFFREADHDYPAAATVLKDHFEKHILKPNTMYKLRSGDPRMEAIPQASPTGIPLKSMGNAELIKLGLPTQRKTRR